MFSFHQMFLFTSWEEVFALYFKKRYQIVPKACSTESGRYLNFLQLSGCRAPPKSRSNQSVQKVEFSKTSVSVDSRENCYHEINSCESTVPLTISRSCVKVITQMCRLPSPFGHVWWESRSVINCFSTQNRIGNSSQPQWNSVSQLYLFSSIHSQPVQILTFMRRATGRHGDSISWRNGSFHSSPPSYVIFSHIEVGLRKRGSSRGRVEMETSSARKLPSSSLTLGGGHQDGSRTTCRVFVSSWQTVKCSFCCCGWCHIPSLYLSRQQFVESVFPPPLEILFWWSRLRRSRQHQVLSSPELMITV